MKSSKPADTSFEEARDKMHRQMLSTVSHDLKTPLATIIGSLEIYTRMDAKLSPEKKTMLIQSALGEAYRLDNFVTNILDMAKLEAGIVRIKPERTELSTIIKDSITKLGPKTVRATINFTPSEGNIIHTDPMLLGRVVGLVMDNAIKHSGKSPIIEIGHEIKDDHGRVTISDNGQGIPDEKMEEIFHKHTRFSRADQQNAGTGLGLSISRLIMALLSGSVTVCNRPQGGAEFTLAFANLK